MQHRGRAHVPRTHALASFLVVTALVAVPTSLGAAAFVQRCVAPLATAQSGRQTIAPGINGTATAQKITAKINLFQCTDTKTTGRSGVLTASTRTTPIACDAFSSAHVWKFKASITWANRATSTLKLSFATSGASRLANVTGTITAGIYAGKSVTAQFKWKPVISPHGYKFPNACDDVVAPPDKRRISVTGDIISTVKPFTVH